jgi:threonine aldolase
VQKELEKTRLRAIEERQYMIYFDQAFWKDKTLHKNLATKLNQELKN